MTALYRSGRQADALRAFRRLRELLGEELGIEPSSALVQLEQAILLQDVTLGWSQAETSKAVGRGALSVSTPAAGRALSNLPESVSSFVGRAAEMVEVGKHLADSRLVTLTGAGGAGKSRLALEVARTWVGEASNGVWLVELAPVTKAEAVPAAVAGALGLAEQTGRGALDTMVDVLPGQERVVVLDNCEHLLDACASLVDVLIRRCPGVRILATSREPLRVEGEAVYRVPPLSLPDEGGEDAAEIARSGAVALFLERAGSQYPASRPSTSSP